MKHYLLIIMAFAITILTAQNTFEYNISSDVTFKVYSETEGKFYKISKQKDFRQDTPEGVAVFDALGFTGKNYYEIAKGIVKNTKDYIKYVDGITNTSVSEIKLEEGSFIATIYGFHITNAFKIKFK